MNRFILHCLFLLMLSYFPVISHAQVITEVSSLEFYENHMPLLEKETTVLIDGRSKEMFEEGHIAGAVFIDAFQDGFLPELSAYAGKSVIVVYCTTRRRTTVLIDALKTFYTGHVIWISDGITGWKQNNLPVVTLSTGS
jgi:rhodanese-related sulfurtransferase